LASSAAEPGSGWIPEPQRGRMSHKHSCPLCGSSSTSNFLKAPDRLHLRRQTYSLIRCHDCSCVWQPAPPAPQDMRVHYDEDYHAGLINAGSSDPGSRWSQPRDMVLKYKRSGSILDIGCSSGGFLRDLATISNQ
jgi:hypothetical protein